MALVEPLHSRREELAPHNQSDAQKTAVHVQRAAAASALAAAILPLRAASSAQAVAEAYEDAFNIMFPAKGAQPYLAWAKSRGIVVR